MSDEQEERPIQRLFSRPYMVVDKAVANALGLFLSLAPRLGRQTWEQRSAGSAQHLIVLPSGTQFIIVGTSAVTASETIVLISFADKKNYDNRRALEMVSQIIDFDLEFDDQHAEQLRQLQEKPKSVDINQIRQQARMIVINTKRRGPEPNPYNAWARDQARNGRKLDDPSFLDEYIQRRGDDPTDTKQRERDREALRKTIERDQKT